MLAIARIGLACNPVRPAVRSNGPPRHHNARRLHSALLAFALDCTGNSDPRRRPLATVVAAAATGLTDCGPTGRRPLFSMFGNGRGRHSSSSSGSSSCLLRLSDACSLRRCVLWIGALVLLANVALLALLQEGPGEAMEHQPNGAPVPGDGVQHVQEAPALLKNRFDRRIALGLNNRPTDAAAQHTPPQPTPVITADPEVSLVTPVPVNPPAPADASQYTERHLVTAVSSASFRVEVLEASQSLVLVDFFAPWCAHCKALAPEFRTAAEQLQGLAKFVAIDATAQKEVAATYAVKSYPTIALFRRGEANPEIYIGPRTAAGLVEFIRQAATDAKDPSRVAQRMQDNVQAAEAQRAAAMLAAQEAALKQAAEAAASAARTTEMQLQAMRAENARAEAARAQQAARPPVHPAPVAAVAPPAAAAPARAPTEGEGAQRVSLWSRKPRFELGASVGTCDAQFGNGFEDPPESYCDPPSNPAAASALHCSFNPTIGGSQCSVSNFALDLSKLTVSLGGEPISSVRGRSEGEEFVRYAPGAFTLACNSRHRPPTQANLPHHLFDMVSATSYTSEAAGLASLDCGVWVSEPTLFVTRYEYANLYHSMGDFYNAFAAQWTYGLDDRTPGLDGRPQKIHVVFMDGHSAGALDAVWETLWGERSVSYVRKLKERFPMPATVQGAAANRICFRRGILVNPAYKSALGVDLMGGSRSVAIAGGRGLSAGSCPGPNAPLDDFAKAFLAAHGSEDVDPWTLFPRAAVPSPSAASSTDAVTLGLDLFGRPILPTGLDLTTTPLIVLILRRDYLAHPRLQSLRASRKLANEQQVQSMLAMAEQWGAAYAVAVDFAQMSVAQQLLLVRLSSVLVGIHGAGLSYSLFLQAGAHLLELSPPEYHGRVHFKFFAMWAGRGYTMLSIGEDRGLGHQVDVDKLKAELFRIVRGPNGGKPAIVKPTQGWIAHRGGSTTAVVAAPTRMRPAPRIPADGPYTPGMTDDVLDLVPDAKGSRFAKIDHGEDIPSQAALKSPRAQQPPGAAPAPAPAEHRLCIVVPFRDSHSPTSQGSNRTVNLMEMIPHMIAHLSPHMSLVRDWELIVVEQTEGHVFNKGALFNVGYLHAKHAGCDYMALHDVDQLPLSPRNTYAYPQSGPVHLCSASSQFGFQMAYGTMVGGALLLTMQQFEAVNGYSNFYWGWGQEDDDFYFRLAASFGNVLRLSAEEGRYQALSHPRVHDLDVTPVFKGGTQHLTDTRTGAFDTKLDGISNLKYDTRAVERWAQWPRGVTKVVAQLLFDFMPKDLDGGQL